MNDAIKSDVQIFLRQNPLFQVGKTPALRYFENPETVVLEGISDVKGVKDEMLKMERIVNCCPRLEIAGKTLKEGFGSAHTIALVSRERFNAAITAGNPELQSQADEVYQRAVQQNAKAVAIATEYIRAERGTPLAIMQPRPQTSTSALTANGNSQTADLRTLFGNLDFCECEHCSSVYSPAAYLVDLMQALAGGPPNGSNQSPLDVLFERRPDLAEVDLTCENTNVTVPYIDLLLETLEQACIKIRGLLMSTTKFNMDVGQGELGELSSGRVPSMLSEVLQQKLRTSFEKATVLILSSARWAIRVPGWKINVTAMPGTPSGVQTLGERE